MRVGDMFPSKYLRGSDLPGPVVVTIQSVGQEKVYRPGEGESTAFVLYVKNGSKPIVLSKSLAEGIATALGVDDTDAWPGRKFTLYPQEMKVAGRDLLALRARKAAPANGSDPAGQ